MCISTTGGLLVVFLRTFIFQFSSMFVEYHMIFNRSSNFGGPSMDFFWICIRFSMILCHFVEKVLPAQVGSTILHIDTKHFDSENHFFDVETAPARSAANFL